MSADQEAEAGFVLLQFRMAADAVPRVHDECRAFCEAFMPALRIDRVACTGNGRGAYVYLRAHAEQAADLESLGKAFARRCAWAQDVRCSRIERVFESEGASAGVPAVFHYVVEMDPEAGWMSEISRWYDTEHMPGLAAVPGCVRARRFLNHGHGPLSLACYDLVSEDTLGSPPWLAVRATPWSDITRPHFTNTSRTMLRILGSARPKG